MYTNTSFRMMLLVLAVLSLAACSTMHSADRYSQNEMGTPSYVYRGTVLQVRVVDVEGTRTGIGAGLGALAGGIGGSFVGGDVRTNMLVAIGTALAGGIVGGLAEEAVTMGTALEYVVQREDGEVVSVVQDAEEVLNPGDRVLILDSGVLRIVRDTSAPAATPQVF